MYGDLRVLAVKGDLTHAVCNADCGQMIIDDVEGDFPEAQVWIERSEANDVHMLAGTLACGACGEQVTPEP